MLKPLPDIYVPTFEMVVDQDRLPIDIAKSILEISVTERLDPPGQFSFRLNDPKLSFVGKEDGRFTEGKRVEIGMGYVGNTRKMMVGEISSLTADFPSNGPATLHVDGFDLFHRMTRGTVYRKFEGSTSNSGLPDSEIVSQIAKEAGLKPSVDPTPMRTEPRTQKHVTNLTFLEELAKASGYALWVDGETLYFKRQPPAGLKSLQLEWGKTLTSFSPRLSTAGQVNTVEIRGWDPIQKQSFSVRVQRSGPGKAELASTGQQQIARGAGGRSERVITDAPVASSEEAQAYGEKVLSQQQQALITGSGTAVGQPDLRPGVELQLRGIGRFNGTYVVQQVTHTLSGSGYQTSFEVKKHK